MSRLATWLARQLPACEAQWVEVRDGDEVLSRLSIPRGRPAALEPDIFAAAETVEARNVSVVAVSKEGTDLAAMVISRPGKREQRSVSGLLASVLRDNEALRARVLEVTEQATRALLTENARLAQQNAELMARRDEQHALVEQLRSDHVARELAEREAREKSERQTELMRQIREDWAPSIFRYLGGAAETKAGGALLRVFNSSLQNAGEELSALVARLPPEDAAELSQAVQSAQAAQLLTEREQARKKAAKPNGGTS
jgi:hypothetical protein